MTSQGILWITPEVVLPIRLALQPREPHTESPIHLVSHLHERSSPMHTGTGSSPLEVLSPRLQAGARMT